MDITITPKDATGAERHLEVSIPAEAVAAAEDKTAQRYTSRAQLPGFRPGKAPAGMVRKRFATEIRQEAVQALVTSWGQGMDFYGSDEARAQEIIAAGVGSDISALTTAFEGVEFYDLADNSTQLQGEFTDTVLPMVQEAAVGAGILEGEVEFADSVDPSFVESAS